MGPVSFHSAEITSLASGNGISLRGICYSLQNQPDTSNFVKTSGSGAGSFTTTLNGLTPNTTYHARAFALNNVGISYGDEVIFTTAQAFSVTYKVDISSYLAAGNTVGVNGIRIGGDFASRGCLLPNWTPSDSACAMTNEGNDIWSITVLYPDSSNGKTQRYKFVNNDWGTNEGSPNLVTGGCGVQDGGDVNRILVLPAGGGIIKFCWDDCNTSCQVSVKDELKANGFSIYPNPFEDRMHINSLQEGRITLLNQLGKSEFSAVVGSGNQEIKLPLLPNGLYFLRHSNGKTIPVLRK
jgi:hypothetical protein